MDAFTAVKQEDLSELKNSFHPEDLTTKDKFGCTILYWAAKSGNSEIVQFLLDQGADPSFANTDGIIPIQVTQSTEIAILLLHHHAPTNIRKQTGNTLLYDTIIEGKEEIATILLEQGADPSYPNADGTSPLLAAIATENIHILKLLLDKGADCNQTDADGYTPFLAASEKGSLSCLQALADCSQKDVLSPEGNNALHIAVMNDSVEVLEYLLTLSIPFWAKNNDRQTPMGVAIAKKNRHAEQILRRYIANHILKDCREGNLNMLQNTLAAGADINTRDANGNTPLILAAEFGHSATVEYLLQHGAMPYHKNKSGKTALDIALNEETKKFLS